MKFSETFLGVVSFLCLFLGLLFLIAATEKVETRSEDTWHIMSMLAGICLIFFWISYTYYSMLKDQICNEMVKK